MALDSKGNPIGIIPPVKSTPIDHPIPENKLQTNRKYRIEISKKVSNVRTITKKYIGVLETLKSEKSYGSYKFEYYKFKYLERLNKNDINESEERIDQPIFNGRNKLASLKIYNASAGEDILSLDQIKAMEEIDHKTNGLVVGNTYYVRYIDPSSGDDLSTHNAFRGKYVGTIKRQGNPIEYCFENKVDISKSVSVDERTNITFFYTAEDVNEYDRQRRVFASIFPHGDTIVGDDPSKRFGGNKRKTNKRKTNKRKTNRRKNK